MLTSLKPSRPAYFWLVTIALFSIAIVLLREVLLPFVAGLALAYLLDPLVTRLERIGMHRAAATLLILAVFLLSVITLLLLAIPIIVTEIAILIDKLPAYITRLQRWCWIQAGRRSARSLTRDLLKPNDPAASLPASAPAGLRNS